MKLRRTTARDGDFIALTRKLDDELRGEYGAAQAEYAPHNLVDTETAVVATIASQGFAGARSNEERCGATIDGALAGCGCFKRFDDEAVEIKRFFVDPAHRGKGIARAMLGELEAWAKELGYRAAVLETGVRQAAAIVLYEHAGYSRIPLYGPYVGMDLSICMRKQLG